AVLDDGATRHLDALIVERGGAEATGAERIVDEVGPGRQNRLVEAVLEEGDAAGDGRAGDGAEQGRQHLGRDAVLEDHRRGGRRDLARTDSGDGAATGLGANGLGRRQVGQVAHRAVLSAALHGAVLFGDDADAQREGRALIGAVEAVRRDQTPAT